MSLWADYVKEREGHHSIEEEWGFAEFSIQPPSCFVHSVYIRPEDRRKFRGSGLVFRIEQIAKEQGCTHIWTQVWVPANGSTESLRAILPYGFKLHSALDQIIMLNKEIEG